MKLRQRPNACLHRHKIRVVAILFVAFFSTSASSQDISPDQKATENECTILRVGGPQNWQPVSYETSQGQQIGLGLDILRKYAETKGIKIDTHLEVPWARTLQMLKLGELDVVAGAYYHPARELFYTYSIPFFYDEIMVFQYRNRTFEYNNIRDLVGRRGARVYGGSLGHFIDDYAEKHLDMVFTPTENNIFEMLVAGRVDYVLAGRYDGIASLVETPDPDLVTPIEPPVTRNTVSLMFSKLSPCESHAALISNLIGQLAGDGTLALWTQQHIQLTISHAIDDS